MVTAQSGAGAVTTTGPGQRRRSGNGKYFISENISVLKIFQAENLVLDINPGLLVIVEGLEYAGTVEGARDRPVKLSRPGQLVYSGHMYPFWWDATLPYQEFSHRLTGRQTFVREPGHQYSVRTVYCTV